MVTLDGARAARPVLRTGVPHPASGAAGEHLARVRGPVERVGHLGERHPEHVVQHERHPLRRRQRTGAARAGGS